MPPLIAIVSTHTTRHLRRVLLGVASQKRRADRVLVSCDGESPELREEAAGEAAKLGLAMTLIQRAHAGVSRSGQVRNNAVRALMGDGVSSDALLVFLDGDICAAPDCFGVHERLAERCEVVLGFRHDLTEQQTETFDEAALREGREPVTLSADQRAALTAREKRYARQIFWKRFGFGKKHKPKLLSANFAVRLGAFARVNGFDELYEGYGQEDDDLGRRLYAAGYRPALALRAATAYHLWHPTRAPGDWEKSPNAARFLKGGPVRCVQGLANPKPQGAIRRFEFGRGGASAESGATN
jgi:GT2 family glycosyltransferase